MSSSRSSPAEDGVSRRAALELMLASQSKAEWDAIASCAEPPMPREELAALLAAVEAAMPASELLKSAEVEAAGNGDRSAPSLPSDDESDAEPDCRMSSWAVARLFVSLGVYTVACRSCKAQLCRRAAYVQLVADSAKSLFSTDMVTRYIAPTERRLTTLPCECGAFATECVSCRAELGYHVRHPCRTCLSGDNNGHYWMLHHRAVEAAIRLEPPPPGTSGATPGLPIALPFISWLTLPGLSEDLGELSLEDGIVAGCLLPPQEDERLDTCPICMEVMAERYAMRGCGHAYCRGCAFRQCDFHRVCAMCRAETGGEPPQREAEYAAKVGDVQLYCRWRFTWSKERREYVALTDGGGCQETVALRDWASHMQECPRRRGDTAG